MLSPSEATAQISAIERKTFRLERLRSIAAGITETANATFFGVIAIKYFHCSQTVKGVLLTNTSIGMLLSPVVLWWAAKRGWNTSQGIAIFSFFAAVACLVGLPDQLSLFVIGGMLSYAAAASVAPLYISLYEGNYRRETRGKLFAANYFLRILSNIGFAFAAGILLDHHLSWYPIILVCYALCFAFSGIVVSKMPQVRLEARGGRNPLTAMRHVKEDRVFRWTLVSWMLLGFANLAMFPLRTEYLANPRYGIDLTASQVALYTSVIPNIARLVFNPIWGPLFDKMNFFKLRIILNTGFMLGFLSFFTGTGVWGLVIGAILFGISNAGADVVWNLWVTKIATPDKTAEYMAVHSFLTGVRGVIAPIFAYQLTNYIGIGWIASGCAALVVMASALLWRERGSFTAKDLPEELPAEID
jgi:MFS family permease